MYALSTSLYGVVALTSLLGAGLFLWQGRWGIALIALAMMLVALDNTFCGDRARACGYRVKGHYVVPPFLKR